jgi:hypothetical protein
MSALLFVRASVNSRVLLQISVLLVTYFLIFDVEILSTINHRWIEFYVEKNSHWISIHAGEVRVVPLSANKFASTSLCKFGHDS